RAETRRTAVSPAQPARTRSPHPLGRHPPQTRAAASPRLHLQGEQVSEGSITVGTVAMIGVGAVAAATMMAGALLILALVAAVEAPLIARYVLYRKEARRLREENRQLDRVNKALIERLVELDAEGTQRLLNTLVPSTGRHAAQEDTND